MFETKHWVIEGINQWRQLVGLYNWYTCTLIDIEFEKDDFTHGREFLLIILGLGFRIRYNTDKALELFDKWDDELNVV